MIDIDDDVDEPSDNGAEYVCYLSAAPALGHSSSSWWSRGSAAAEVLKGLAAHFSMAKPEIRVTNRPLHRVRWGDRRVEVLIAGTDPYLRDIVLHQFAHLVAWSRGARIAHGEMFFVALRDVIVAAGLNPSDYCWHNEMKTLWMRAKRQRFTKEPWSGAWRKARKPNV